MTIYVRLTVGAVNAPLATWDSVTQTWDSIDALWDDISQSTIGTPFYDVYTMMLRKSTADNNSSSRLEMTFPNQAGLHTSDFSESAEVFLYADKDISPPTTLRFGGIVTEKTFEGSGSNKEKVKLMARDFTAILQKNTIEPTVYTNQEVSIIVINLIGLFAPSSFTTNNVSVTSLVLDRITFKQVNLFDALKQLADLAGCVFWVDETKDVHFVPASVASSGLTFDNVNVRKSQFVTDVDSVKNRIFVYGNRQLVAQPTATFTSDGIGSVFTLLQAPANVSLRSPSGGNIKKGDVFNAAATAPSGVDYLVNYYDKTIILRSGTDLGYSTIPASGTAFTVDYFVSKPIVKVAEDFTSQAAYYKRTEIIQDDNINDPVVAKRIAKNQIALKKDPAVQGTMDIQGVVDVTPGTTCIVNMPFQNIVLQQYDILEAAYNFNPKNCFEEQVLKVKVSQRIKDVTDILKDLILSERRLAAAQIDDTATITRLLTGAGSAGLKVPTWTARSRAINDSFVFGHPVNGVIGEVGSPLHGTQYSGVTSWSSGTVGLLYDKSAQFTGSGNGFWVSGINSGSLSQFSISVWVQPTELNTDGNNNFRHIVNSVANGNFFIVEETGSISFRVPGVTSVNWVAGSAPANTWTHIVASYDQSFRRMYVNGALVGSDSIGAGTVNIGAISIGRKTDVAGFNSFVGYMDDMRIYNKALALTEVGSLYAKNNYPTGSLYAYWTFDEGSGAYAYSSASGLNYRLQPIIGDRRGSTVVIRSGGEI